MFTCLLHRIIHSPAAVQCLKTCRYISRFSYCSQQTSSLTLKAVGAVGWFEYFRNCKFPYKLLERSQNYLTCPIRLGDYMTSNLRVLNLFLNWNQPIPRFFFSSKILSLVLSHFGHFKSLILWSLNFCVRN